MGRISRNIFVAMREVVTIACNELVATLKDTGVIIIFFAAGLLYPVLYSFIYLNETVRDIPVAVVDDSHTSLSRKFIRAMDATPDVAVVCKPVSMNCPTTPCHLHIQSAQSTDILQENNGLALSAEERQKCTAVSQDIIVPSKTGTMARWQNSRKERLTTSQTVSSPTKASLKNAHANVKKHPRQKASCSSPQRLAPNARWQKPC